MEIDLFDSGSDDDEGVQNPGAEAEMEDIEVEDSKEGGVSSIVSSSGEQAITWGDESGASTGTTSSSPQRQAAQVISSLLNNSSFHSISSSGQTG